MLSLYHAPDLETLGALACRLLAQPQADVLAPARVVVPSQGIGRWLTLQLAREQGLAEGFKTGINTGRGGGQEVAHSRDAP